MGIFTRVLTLLCSLLVALPSGWCCVFVPAACCGKQQSAERGTPAPHKNCCCRSKPAQQNDNEPKSNGSAPAKPCSCEKAPSVPSDMARFVPDLLVQCFERATEFAHFSITEQIQSGRPAGALSPPLHVSHCVWLC
jgi:hypothetical protein